MTKATYATAQKLMAQIKIYEEQLKILTDVADSLKGNKDNVQVTCTIDRLEPIKGVYIGKVVLQQTFILHALKDNIMYVEDNIKELRKEFDRL